MTTNTCKDSYTLKYRIYMKCDKIVVAVDHSDKRRLTEKGSVGDDEGFGGCSMTNDGDHCLQKRDLYQ